MTTLPPDLNASAEAGCAHESPVWEGLVLGSNLEYGINYSNIKTIVICLIIGQQNFTTEIKVENEPDSDIEPADSLDGSQDIDDDALISDGDWIDNDESSDSERMNDDERKKYEEMIEQRMNEDDEGWSSDSTENELVIDESRENGYTDSDDVGTDDDVDGVGDCDCGKFYFCYFFVSFTLYGIVLDI